MKDTDGTDAPLRTSFTLPVRLQGASCCLSASLHSAVIVVYFGLLPPSLLDHSDGKAVTKQEYVPSAYLAMHREHVHIWPHLDSSLRATLTAQGWVVACRDSSPREDFAQRLTHGMRRRGGYLVH